MEIVKTITDILFGFALFGASIAKIPQIIKIIHVKDTTDFSIISYMGFNIFQLGMALHGYLQNDKILLFGSLACFIPSIIIITLIFLYRKTPQTTLRQ